ncbi:Ribonuclease H domain [Sesbania bispinosa]|nr:Ribonuclease H domain [Sesbania bispinosa]
MGRSAPDGFRCPVWSPPPLGITKINVDGSCLLDSSRMRVCGVFRGLDSKWILGFSGFVGLGDNLLAEIQAVYWGLKMAWDRGFRRISLESDARDVIQHLNFGGPIQVNSSQVFLDGVRELLRRPWEVTLRFSPRETNKAADWPARDGARTASSPVVLDSPPPEVVSRLLIDDLGL